MDVSHVFAVIGNCWQIRRIKEELNTSTQVKNEAYFSYGFKIEVYHAPPYLKDIISTFLF